MAEPDVLVINGDDMHVVSAKTPAELPWKKFGVDIVIEATGLFTEAEKAKGHLTAGAKKVIISAPAKERRHHRCDGRQPRQVDAKAHNIISNASCTTNCLAPLVHVLLKEGFGIEEGLMTTVHSYTATQKTVDGRARRIGRVAAPRLKTSSPARPVPPGRRARLPRSKRQAHRHGLPRSDADRLGRGLDRQDDQGTSYKEICAAFKKASETYLKGYLGYTEDEVVSSDFIHSELSSIFDAGSGIELNSKFFKLVSWYDNEWGYSHRVADLVKHLIAKGL